MEQILIKRYLAKFDELNSFSETLLKSDSKEEAIDKFDDILIDAYIEGFSSAAYILGDIRINQDDLSNSINKSYEGISIRDKIGEYYEIQDQNSAKNLIESEYHRVYNTARDDAYYGYKKQWITVGDDKVREMHSFLEGVTVNSGERFYTIDGDSALFPGDFVSANNNANCRCVIDYIKP